MRQFVIAAMVVGVSVSILAGTQLGGAAMGLRGSAAANTPTPTQPPNPPGNHAPVAHDGEAYAFSGYTLYDISPGGA